MSRFAGGFGGLGMFWHRVAGEDGRTRGTRLDNVAADGV
jgi:hypothetical protein